MLDDYAPPNNLMGERAKQRISNGFKTPAAGTMHQRQAKMDDELLLLNRASKNMAKFRKSTYPCFPKLKHTVTRVKIGNLRVTGVVSNLETFCS